MTSIKPDRCKLESLPGDSSETKSMFPGSMFPKSMFPKSRRCVPLALVVSLLVAAAAILIGATPASACSVIGSGYRLADTGWESNLTGEILPFDAVTGVYRREATASVGPGGGWKRGDLINRSGRSRGSVLTVVETWGEVPGDLGPIVQGNDVVTENSCPGPSDGLPVGRSTYHLVLEGSTNDTRLGWPNDNSAEERIESLFGPSASVPGDPGAEQALVDDIRSSRNSPWSGIAALAALGAGVVGFIVIKRQRAAGRGERQLGGDSA